MPTNSTSKKKISFWSRVFDLIAPRACVICGDRLALEENTICGKCNMHLPRTEYHLNPYENEMAKLFWAQIPIERATAFFYYEGHSQVSNILYALKYGNHPEIGIVMGRMLGREIVGSGFFEDIDIIIPIPLAHKRRRQRGYNQSLMIAKGISEITQIPINNKIVNRLSFSESQTHKDRWGRSENVKGVFLLEDGDVIRNKHILIVDDVVTTGATVISCSKELMKAESVKISVISLGFAKS